MASHRFGGDWTEEKLTRLRKYLEAYTKIFKRNPQAHYFKTTYVDAFAGTGSREDSKARDATEASLSLILDESISRFFLDRLGEVFEAVSQTPLWLWNSRRVPIYLLCFAAGNPKGASTALKIADHILRH